MIQPIEARDLCSKSEWELIRSSFSPVVETLERSDLKSRVDRARHLYRKTTERMGGKPLGVLKPTRRRKAELFAEAVARFGTTLNTFESDTRVESMLRVADNGTLFGEETPAMNLDVLRERAGRTVESRKSKGPSALAAQAEQQREKFGAMHISSHVGSFARRRQATREIKSR